MDRLFRVFTDGSTIGNPGPGGWGAVLIRGKYRWEISGASTWTTIEEMELLAAIEALRSLSKDLLSSCGPIRSISSMECAPLSFDGRTRDGGIEKGQTYSIVSCGPNWSN